MAAASLTEFWAIATHPAFEGRPSTPAQAAAFVRALVQRGAQIWLPGLASRTGSCSSRPIST